MLDDDWAKFTRIAELERDLDDAFPIDEIMERYFRPFEVREPLPQDWTLSLGSVLLSWPNGFVGELYLDGLISYYRSVALADVLSSFYSNMVTTFFSEPAETCSDLNGFMTFLDGVLANTQDKWDLMDAATDPLKHIERLRGLIEGVSGFIAKRSDAFAELIAQERKGLLTFKSTDLEVVNSIGFDLAKDDIGKVFIRPCMLSFNLVSYAKNEDGSIYIQLGIFAYRIIKLRSNKYNTKMLLNLLKLLADETRFNALHDMRNRYSYGQELAEKLKCTRNTMYYHLEKMIGLGLIRCRETEYRMLYTMNKKTVYEKLTSLRDYLTDGWKPGDPDEPEEGGE
ncbi:MAG: helix-turn-helix transcriptional regulator [Clostridia bacterium]|nr:helix-turn-helix transcriptional regulator [Clostridia bacterium]